MLNPNWLHTFKTLIDTGPFTKTAEKLYMTQPGVSQHINKLEEACGYILIQRDKKSYELTEQGALVYQYAKQLENSEANLFDQLGLNEPYAGKCQLACSGSLALLLYPKLLNLQCQFPKLVIDLEAAPDRIVLRDVQDGNTDIGIVTSLPNSSLFDIEEIGCEPLSLVLPNDSQYDINSTRFLSELGLIRHPNVEHYLSLFFTQSGVEEFSGLNSNDLIHAGYVNQLNQILLPVANGLGFTILPQSTVESFEQRDRLQIFTPNREVNETLYMLTKRNRILAKRFELVIDIIKQNCQPLATV